MAKKATDEKARFVLYLPEDLAKRLKLAAVNQNRAACDLAAELLDRHLPRAKVHQAKNLKKIPYA